MAGRVKYLRICLWLLVVCALAEAFSRLVFCLPEHPDFNRILYMPIAPTQRGGGGARAIRSIRVVKESLPDGVLAEQTLNEYGFRGRLRIRRTGTASRVVFIGDSFVEGAYIPDDATLPRAFEATAAEKGVRVEAINLGVAGGGFQSYPALVLDALHLLKPETIVLVVYANDLPAQPDMPVPRVFPPRPALEPWLPAVLAMAWRREQLPFRWSWRRERFYKPVPSPSNPWSSAEFQKENRARVSQRMFDAMREARFSSLRIGGSLYMEQALRVPFDLRAGLARLRNAVEEQQSRLAVVYLPERGMVTNYYKSFEREFSIGLPVETDLTTAPYQLHRVLLGDQCAETGLAFLDLTETIRAQEAHGNHLYHDYDDHLSSGGARLLGAAIFHWLAAGPGRSHD